MDQIRLDELIKRCGNGESVQSVCNDLGLSRNTVYAYCKKHNIPLKSKFVYKPFKFKADKRQKIALDYINGGTSTSIAKKYHVSHKTILKCVKEFNLKVRTVDDNRKLNGDPGINALIISYKQTSAAKRLGFELSYETFKELILQNCYYCGNKPMQKRVIRKSHIELVYTGIDRIDSTKGYQLGNVVPACYRCNDAKNNMTLNEFRDLIRRIINHGVLIDHGCKL